MILQLLSFFLVEERGMRKKMYSTSFKLSLFWLIKLVICVKTYNNMCYAVLSRFGASFM